MTIQVNNTAIDLSAQTDSCRRSLQGKVAARAASLRSAAFVLIFSLVAEGVFLYFRLLDEL
jgi:hypothetical protein